MSNLSFDGHAIVASFADDLAPQVRSDGDAVAEVLTDPLRCAYPEGNVLRLSGAATTPRSLTRAIEAVADLDAVQPVLLYFSGHGYVDTVRGESGLLLADPDDPTVSVPWRSADFARVWTKLPARRKLVVIDSCNAGGTPAVKGGSPAKAEPIVGMPDPATLRGGSGSAVIASSASDQQSVVMPGDDLSLFTKFLVAGLRGEAGHDPDGYVTLFDLFNFVRVKVVGAYPKQTPVLSANGIDDNFRLALSHDASQQTTRRKIPEQHAQSRSGMRDLLAVLYPLGPGQGEIWERSGGALAQLDLSGSGAAQWWTALRKLEQGGGGRSITVESLLDEVLVDYPRNRDVLALKS